MHVNPYLVKHVCEESPSPKKDYQMNPINIVSFYISSNFLLASKMVEILRFGCDFGTSLFSHLFPAA